MERITERSVLSVIVPLYNEEAHLADVIDYLMTSPCSLRREWIFVDDCSTDNSMRILDTLRGRPGVTIIQQPRNQGKGAAVARGIQAASGDVIMIQDADFEYDARDISSLLQPFLDGRADVVFGSRFKNPAMLRHPAFHYRVNQFLTILSNLCSGMHLTDMETCYKLFRADLVKAMRLKSKRFGIEVELTAYTAKTDARIFELPINYFPRTHLQGKKITWKDGVAALFHIVRFNCLTSLEGSFRITPERYNP